MKKLMIVLSTLLLVILLTSSTICADYMLAEKSSNMTMFVDDIVMEDGLIAEKITADQLISNLAKIEKMSTSRIMEKYDINPLTDNSSKVANYKLSKICNFQFPSKKQGTGSHEVYVTLLRSNDFTVHYVNTIINVYNSDFVLSSDEFFLESSSNYINSWDSSKVNAFYSGNISYKSKFYSAYTYREYSTFSSTFKCPQW